MKHGMGLALLLFAFWLPSYVAAEQPETSRFNALVTHVGNSVLATDIALTKIAIDKYIAPQIDETAVQAELARLTAMAWLSVPLSAPASERMNALLAFLYAPGPWNEYRPFSYDLEDPFGSNIDNKLLSTYLRTRRGNCVSMPVLLVILGQRLGLRTTQATAPSHVLAKFKDERGIWHNVEATAGGYKADSSYRRELHITDRAMETGIYLRPLSMRESTAVLLSTAMESQRSHYDTTIALADLALELYPHHVVAMVHKASAIGRRNVEFIENVYPDPRDLPPDLAAEYVRLSHLNQALFAQAEALGWREPTREEREQYVKEIEAIKEQRN